MNRRVDMIKCWKRCPISCMRSNAQASEALIPQPAIRDQAYLCGRVSLVKDEVPQREKDWMPLDALRRFDDMRMVAHNQIVAVSDQPPRFPKLHRIRQPLIFLAPMNGNHDKIGPSSCYLQFLGNLVGRNSLHAAICSGNYSHRNQRDLPVT